MKFEAILPMLANNYIKTIYEDNKKRWCLYGQGGAIARCLRSSKIARLKIDGEIYKLEEVTQQIYQMTEIKLAIEEIFE